MEHAHTVDASLVAEALGGDRDAFGALVVRYFNPAYAVALAHLGHHESAQDAVQEAFLNAYRRLNTLRDPERFREWLITIVRNACYSLRRKERPMVPLDAVAEPAEALDLERRELHALIRSKIAELDESPREALLLYYFSGQSQAEIADLLGISQDAAQKRVSRAREVLGQRLVDEVEGALGLNAEERKKREKQALAAVMAAPIPWDITKASAVGGAASVTSTIPVSTWWMAVVVASILVTVLVWWTWLPSQITPHRTEPAPVISSGDVAQAHAAAPTELSPSVDLAVSASPDLAAESRWSTDPPQTTGGLQVTGVVVDERDRFAAGCTVRLTVIGYRGDDPVQHLITRRETQTDTEGWFRFDDLPFHVDDAMENDYVIDASLGELVAHSRLYSDNVFESRQLRLEPGGSISGVAQNSAGEGVAGARLYPISGPNLPRLITADQLAWMAVTDASGNFVFPALPAGTWSIAAVKEGVATKVVEGIVTRSTDAVVALDGGDRSGQITGIVRDAAGATVADAWVVLDYKRVRWIEQRWARTDADGRFHFDSLGAGDYAVEVEDPRWCMPAAGPLVTMHDEAETTDVTLAVAPAAVVQGRVTQEDTGAEIPGVTIYVYPSSSEGRQWWSSNQCIRRAVTDDQGQYVIDGLRPVDHIIQCGELPRGLFLQNDGQQLPKLQVGEVRAMDFVAHPGIEVRGHVVDEKGRPLGVCHFRYYGASTRTTRITASNANGELRVAGVTAALDDLTFEVRKAGWAMVPRSPERISGAGSTSIEVLMRPECCARGMVKDNHGNPVAGAGVMARKLDGSTATGGVTNTDSKGRFFLPGFYPGQYDFAVTPPDSMRYGGADRQGPLAIEARITDGIELQFDTESNLTIEGTVRDTNGKLVIAEVIAHGPVEARDMTFTQLGHFTLRGVSPGEYRVTAWRQGTQATVNGIVAGAKDVEIVIEAAAAVSGKVVDAVSGTAINEYLIGYVAQDAESDTVLWNREPTAFPVTDGAFVFSDDKPTNSIPAADLTLTVIADGYAAARVPLGIVDPGEARTDVEVRLTRSAPLQGRVTDARGHGVAAASILARCNGTGTVPPITVQSDSDGTFSISSIAPEHELLVVTHPDYAAAALELPAALTNVVLTDGSEVTGLVLLDGEPRNEQHVYWRHDALGVSGNAPSDADGSFRLNHLPAGEVELRAYLRPEEDGPALELSRNVIVQEGSVTETSLTGIFGHAMVVLETQTATRRSARLGSVNK